MKEKIRIGGNEFEYWRNFSEMPTSEFQRIFSEFDKLDTHATIEEQLAIVLDCDMEEALSVKLCDRSKVLFWSKSMLNNIDIKEITIFDNTYKLKDAFKDFNISGAVYGSLEQLNVDARNLSMSALNGRVDLIGKDLNTFEEDEAEIWAKYNIAITQYLLFNCHRSAALYLYDLIYPTSEYLFSKEKLTGLENELLNMPIEIVYSISFFLIKNTGNFANMLKTVSNVPRS